MNMSSEPTKQQLKEIFATCDDSAGPHVLWVDSNGDVKLELVLLDPSAILYPGTKSPAFTGFLFRFNQGNGYVGKDASEDSQHINRMYKELVNEWRKRTHGEPKKRTRTKARKEVPLAAFPVSRWD